MKAAEIIEACSKDGVSLTLSPAGTAKASGDKAAEWIPVLREHKTEIIAELHREARRSKVMAMLEPGRKYAVLVEDEHADPVIATCAIAGMATFELAIPRHSFNGMVLLELVEKHSMEGCTK